MNVNLLSVVLGGLSSMIIGFFYYSKPVLGSRWIKLVALSEKDLKKNGSWKNYAVVFLTGIIMSFIINALIVSLAITLLSDGIKFAILVWLGFVATTSLTNSIFAQRPAALYLIDTFYHLLVILSISLITVAIG